MEYWVLQIFVDSPVNGRLQALIVGYDSVVGAGGGDKSKVASTGSSTLLLELNGGGFLRLIVFVLSTNGAVLIRPICLDIFGLLLNSGVDVVQVSCRSSDAPADGTIDLYCGLYEIGASLLVFKATYSYSYSYSGS
jgi:hypothetical protein